MTGAFVTASAGIWLADTLITSCRPALFAPVVVEDWSRGQCDEVGEARINDERVGVEETPEVEKEAGEDARQGLDASEFDASAAFKGCAPER